MHIEFTVRCDACGQVLNATKTDEGLTMAHGNPADCPEPPVELPLVTPEQLAAVFAGKETKHKPAEEKDLAKKKAK